MGKEIEQLVKISDVAEKLGLSISGVRKLVSRKVIPVYRISRSVMRFRWTEVEAAIARYRQREIS